MEVEREVSRQKTPLEGYQEPNCLVHRAKSAAFLRAQATTEIDEVKYLAQQVSGRRNRADTAKKTSSESTGKRRRKTVPVGNGEGVDWGKTVDDMLSHDARILVVCGSLSASEHSLHSLAVTFQSHED
jgi:DNA polymerase gamma 1